MSSELASMLKEIEDVIRKYRVRLESGADSSTKTIADDPEIKRLKILKYVSENQPVKAIDLYEEARAIGISRQGLGGFYREAVEPGGSGSKSASLIRDDSDGSDHLAKISIGRYGEIQLELLLRKHGPVS